MAREVEEADSVRRVVTGVAHHIDGKQWAELRALYADEVRTDYASLFGGEPQMQSGDALIAGWSGVLETVATQHLLGPIDVAFDGPGATARCHVRALHHATGAPGGDLWEVLGHYVFTLLREGEAWRISGMALETFAQTGNARLLAEAATRR
jgi:hypothetical protein